MAKIEAGAAPSRRMRGEAVTHFFGDVLRGAAIGIAFIIPGFSGGSVAAILGIYERLVGAIADLFKHFRESLAVLLPVALGMLLGVAALIFPIQWGITNYPLPTVSLFVGLAIGGLPPLKAQAGSATGPRVSVLIGALVFAVLLAFLPTVTLPQGFLYRLDLFGYLLLFLVGLIASCALVVPGISGSMLLLIFGYYTPLVTLLTDFILFGKEPAASLAVIGVAGAGMLVGFFLISAIMKRLLASHPHGTYFAILGFIVGSVAAVFAPVLRSTPYLTNVWYWLASAALLGLGIAVSYLFVKTAKTHKKT